MGDIRQIRVGGHKVGINGLDQALEQMPDHLAQAGDQEIGEALVGLLQDHNYFPPRRAPSISRPWPASAAAGGGRRCPGSPPRAWS